MKRLNIRKQPSFGWNLFCTLNHDQHTFLSTGFLYNLMKYSQNVQLNRQEECSCEPFFCRAFL